MAEKQQRLEELQRRKEQLDRIREERRRIANEQVGGVDLARGAQPLNAPVGARPAQEDQQQQQQQTAGGIGGAPAAQQQQDAQAATQAQAQQPVKPARKWNLNTYNFVCDYHLAPKERILLDMEIQCELITKKGEQDGKGRANNNAGEEGGEQANNDEDQQALPAVHRPRNPGNAQDGTASKPEKEDNPLNQFIQTTELTQDDIDEIIESRTFKDFFNRSSKIIEKALETKDFVDVQSYVDQAEEQADDDEQNQKDALTSQLKFLDLHYSRDRIVTALEWSPIVPETFLAAYSQNEDASANDSAGVALIWQLGLKNRPEYHCFCQSPVTSACFYPFQSNIVIGGLYNGNIVTWDLRAKGTPVQRTNQDGHAYPVYSLAVVGTQHAHNIVSISNDGFLCVWNMRDLSQPQKSVKLQTDNQEMNVTSMCFKPGDVNNYFIGTENGMIYSTQLHSQDAARFETFKGHELAPITSISVNGYVPESQHLLSGLMLSGSYDWSVKLWSPKVSNKSLWTFESDDYIYDVQWNPANPLLFASSDSERNLNVWDITQSVQKPLAKQQMANHSVHKLRWSHDGHRLLAGDTNGTVHVHTLNRKYHKYNKNSIPSLEESIEAKLKVSDIGTDSGPTGGIVSQYGDK